jgi:hypothetical protein
MLTSKYHIRAKAFPFVLVLFLCWPFAIKHFIHPNFQSIFIEIIFLWAVPTFVFIAFWYFCFHYFIELQINPETVRFKRFFGFGKTYEIPFQYIDSYKIETKKDKQNPTYELLTLYRKNKKIISINQFYLSNYLAFRKLITDTILLEEQGFTFDLGGFVYKTKQEKIRVNWSDILKIETYKIDQITLDSIVISVQTADTTFTLTEDSPHWNLFTNQLEHQFPSIDPHWKSTVMKPAFEKNLLVLFEKKN